MRCAHAKTGRVMQDGMLGVGNSCSLFRHMLLGLGWQSIRGQGGWLGPATAGTRIRCPGQVSPIGWPVSDSSGCSIVCYRCDILQGPCSIVVELVSFWLPCVASHNGMFDNAALLLACVVLEVQATLWSSQCGRCKCLQGTNPFPCTRWAMQCQCCVAQLSV